MNNFIKKMDLRELTELRRKDKINENDWFLISTHQKLSSESLRTR